MRVQSKDMLSDRKYTLLCKIKDLANGLELLDQ